MSENGEQVKIGQKLRAAREAKGLTLDDLQQATKIQKRYLIAIEDEKFDELPGDFYVRAFVKQYANTVGLDGTALLKDYDDELPETKTADYSEHLSQAVETRAGKRQPQLEQVSWARRYLPTIIIAVVVVVILAAIWLTTIVRNRQDAATKIDTSSVSVSGESSKKAVASSKKAATKKPTAKKLTFTVTNRTPSMVTLTTGALTKASDLKIESNAQAWNSVTVDGTTRLNKTMAAKDPQTISLAKDVKTVTLRLGNAGQTTVKIGNQVIDLTDKGKYPATRTVTLQFGSAAATATSNSTSARTSTSTATTTGPARPAPTQPTNQPNRPVATQPTRSQAPVNQVPTNQGR